MTLSQAKEHKARNQTIQITPSEKSLYSKRLISLNKNGACKPNVTICQDFFEAVKYLPDNIIDLLFVDPPYNLSKQFGETRFPKMSHASYKNWTEKWLTQTIRLLKATASIYVCGDWRTSGILMEVLAKHFKIHNRITFARDKGRGAQKNWKNNSEDIWFCTVSDTYYFNVEEVKTKKQVIAPYRTETNQAKGWQEESRYKYRLTYPSNIWNDITIPFWAMPENTSHPTQKPEKLVAKIILASSQKGDTVMDPFLGVGTTSVVAKKLGRHYIGIEKDYEYACLAEKRLELANHDKTIQGYGSGVFYERNAKIYQDEKGKEKWQTQLLP